MLPISLSKACLAFNPPSLHTDDGTTDQTFFDAIGQPVPFLVALIFRYETCPALQISHYVPIFYLESFLASANLSYDKRLSITKSYIFQPQYLWHAMSLYVRVAVHVVALLYFLVIWVQNQTINDKDCQVGQ